MGVPECGIKGSAAGGLNFSRIVRGGKETKTRALIGGKAPRVLDGRQEGHQLPRRGCPAAHLERRGLVLVAALTTR